MTAYESSLRSAIEEKATKYKDVDGQITTLSNYKRLLEQEIIDMLNLLEGKKASGLKIENQKLFKPVTIEEVTEIFPSGELAGKVVVFVNIDKTVENLRYVEGIQDAFIKKIELRLNELAHDTHERLVTGRERS